MEILVVRHGQSIADLEERHEGRADYELTELGLKQASAVAHWISRNYRLDKIYASTLKRAAKTAEMIAAATAVEVTFDEALMEWNNGLLAGMLRTEAEKRYPLPAGGRKPHDEHFETESMIQFRARAEMFWSRMLHSHGQEERICIVSHGGMINMLFRSFLELPMSTGVALATSDTGVHLWRVNGSGRFILFSNKQEHLVDISD